MKRFTKSLLKTKIAAKKKEREKHTKMTAKKMEWNTVQKEKNPGKMTKTIITTITKTRVTETATTTVKTTTTTKQ